MRKARKQKMEINEQKNSSCSDERELTEMTNTAKRSTHRFLPLALSRHCAYFQSILRQRGRRTHERTVCFSGCFLSGKRALHASRNRSRKPRERGTLIVHALHLMNCRTKSTIEESENRLTSKMKHIYYHRISLTLLYASLLLWPILRERSS